MQSTYSEINESNKFLAEVQAGFRKYSDTQHGITVPELSIKMGLKPSSTRLYRYMHHLILRGHAIPKKVPNGKTGIVRYLLPKCQFIGGTPWPSQQTYPSFDDLVQTIIHKKKKGIWNSPRSEAIYLAEVRILKGVLIGIGWQDGQPMTLKVLKELAAELTKRGYNEAGVRTRIGRIRELYDMGFEPRKKGKKRKRIVKSQPKPIEIIKPPLLPIPKELCHYGFIRRVFYGAGGRLKAIWRVIW